MIISHSLQLIFISNPKTGTKSIEAALAPYQDEPHINEIFKDGLYTKRHMPAAEMRDILPTDVWNTYFKVAFVRNPWDWLISQHFYNIEKGDLAGNLYS